MRRLLFPRCAPPRQRKIYSDKTLQELKLFLLTPGRIAIFDSSNVTSERRLEVCF